MLELEEGPSPADITLNTESITVQAIEVASVQHRVAYCFHCRKDTAHLQTLVETAAATYWGPKIQVNCGECGAVDGDIFPGRERNY